MLSNAARSGAGTSLTDSMAGSTAGAIAKGKAALRLGESDSCFSQLAAKSRWLSYFQGLAGRVQAAAPSAVVSVPTQADAAQRGAAAKTIAAGQA